MALTRLQEFIQKQKPRKSRLIIRIVVVFIWAVCLGLVLWGGWKSRTILLPYLINANYFRFIGVFIAYLGSLLAAIIGWSAIMHSFHRGISWWKNTQIYCLTLAARRLPGTFWYVGGRLVIYKQLGVPRKVTAVASSIEFIVSLISGAILGMIILLSSGNSLPIQIVIAIVIGSLIGIMILHPSVLRTILNRDGNKLVQTIRLQNFLVWFLANIIMWVLGGLMIGQILLAFQPHATINILFIVGAWTLSGTAGLLTFFLPSSFGVTEVTLAVLLSQIMPLPLAGAIAILTRLVTILFEVILSAAFYPFARLPAIPELDPSIEEESTTARK
jgi:glycosyltransferase 2 family protein